MPVGLLCDCGLPAPNLTMARHQDDQSRQMPPLSNPRSLGWRAVLSAIAGGGLTAAALGPLASGAIAETPSTTTSPCLRGSWCKAGEATEETSTQPSTTSSTTTTPAPAPPASTPTSTTTTTTTSTPAAEVPAPAKGAAKTPAVVLQRKQKTSTSKPVGPTTSSTQPTTTTTGPQAVTGNNVAQAPEVVAAQAGALAAELAGSAASTQALDFYRIPLFLLPIYQAAAVQYGVPWQILAAINEIETNYGTDQSVSTAGAVGWMQFMPATWIQYGVDALDAGYADPYNPVDAIFAAARYLRAAGAATDLHGAILAYNHSEEYVDSVLLRAKLISSYPKAVIATLTGLIDGRLPVEGKHVAWSAPTAVASSSSTAATNAVAAQAPSKLSAPTTASPPAAPSPTAAAAGASASKKGKSSAPPLQLVDVMSAPNAGVVAAQDGRVVKLGKSRELGKYVVLRDVYGDVFTYAGLGTIAPRYSRPKAPHAAVAAGKASALALAQSKEAKPKLPATAGRQLPLTLKVKAPKAKPASSVSVPDSSETAAPATGKVRLFAHPGNPDALAAAASKRAKGSSHSAAGHLLPLRAGSIVSKGTVLGRVLTPHGAHDGHLRFAIEPAGDQATIDPRAILQNWVQLDTALHPQGASGETDLLGATAGGVFLLSKSELQRAVLSDPGISIYACGRQDIASGAIDKRVLAVLEFLSRSGLKPTVSALECGHSEMTVSGFVSEHYTGDAVDISAINGIPIAGHQGAGTITDTTIRALLTLQGEFVPHQIISLMQYPGAPNTLAMPEHWDHIHIGFHPTAGEVPAHATAAHSAAAGKTAPVAVLVTNVLSSTQWNRLITHVGTLPAPKVAVKPSSSAIKDPKSTQVPASP
jgi:soluble lytic murein transglycosylase-like protein